MTDKMVVFKGKKIRRVLHNDEWWFSVADVVEALADSLDPRQYIKRMRQRDSELNSYWGTICTPLNFLPLTERSARQTALTLRVSSVLFNLSLRPRPSLSSAG